jgi:hypothetical protein
MYLESLKLIVKLTEFHWTNWVLYIFPWVHQREGVHDVQEHVICGWQNQWGNLKLFLERSQPNLAEESSGCRGIAKIKSVPLDNEEGKTQHQHELSTTDTKSDNIWLFEQKHRCVWIYFRTWPWYPHGACHNLLIPGCDGIIGAYLDVRQSWHVVSSSHGVFIHVQTG